MKKKIIAILIAVVGILGGGAVAYNQLGGSYATAPITIIGVAPTSTTVNTYNTESISTTTPTITEYVHFGPEIDQIDMFLIAQATSTDNKILTWDVTTSPLDSSNATSSINFYAFDASSSSSGTITHESASTTNSWTLSTDGAYKRRVTICSNNYDGGDDIQPCNGGWYKFEFGISTYSGIELYAEVVGKKSY